MYNLDFEKSAKLNQEIVVRGRIDFEHPDKDNIVQYYSLRRKWVYRKELKGTKLISQSCSLQRKKGDDWGNPITYPERMIEQILPCGLSQYFFFDGETMIADLRVKGKDSAGKLRKALFSMFDLDVIESAIDHIGRTDLKTTVLGKLYLSKGTIASGGQISVIKTNIENAQNRHIHDVEKRHRDVHDHNGNGNAKKPLEN